MTCIREEENGKPFKQGINTTEENVTHKYSRCPLACDESLHRSPTTFWNSSADLSNYKTMKVQHIPHRPLS